MKKSSLIKDIKKHGFKVGNTDGFNRKEVKKMNRKLSEIITDLNKVEGGYNNIYYIKKYKGRMFGVKKSNADENAIYITFIMIDLLNGIIHNIDDGQAGGLWSGIDPTTYDALLIISEHLEQKIISLIGDTWIKKGFGSGG